MAGNEWVVRVTADVKGVLDASRQIGQAGKQAGQQFKEGFSSGDQTITGLRGRLNELNQTLEKSVIGSKEFVAAQRQIAQAQTQVDSALRGGTSVMNGFGKALEGVAAQAALFFGLYEAITFVGKAVVELDTAGAAVRTLGVDSKELSNAFLGLSNELNNNISQADLLKASYDVASSGFGTTAELVDILRASALGATGGFSELGDVTRAVTAVINSYGLTAKDAGKVVDSFVQTQNDGVITVKQFGENIGNIAAVAAAAGIPLSELSAAIGTATLKGVPVAQTFTGLRQAISSIIKPTDQATTLAAQLGLSYDLASLRARGFAGFLADVVEKTKGSADSIAILTGSVEAQAPIQQIVNDALKEYNQQLSNYTNNSNQAAKASEIATETIAAGFNQIVNATKNLAGQVNTALPGAAGGFSKLAKTVSLGADVFAAVGPKINAALSFALSPLDKLTSGYLDAITKLLRGSKELEMGDKGEEKAYQLEKQARIQAVIDKQLQDQKAIEGEILGVKREKNLADQVANENARKLVGAYGDLAKAQIDQQVRVSQAGINLGQALISLEDSRFGIIRNRNNYELQEAEKRGASEGEINAIKRQGDEIDRAALTFKYNALVQQQELQRVLLALQQEQAQLDAGSAASSAKLDLERAVLDLKAAQLANDTVAAAKAEVEIQKAQLSLQAANTKLETLTKIQAVESLIAGVTNETAQNQIKAEAAAKNLALAADGTFKAAQGTRDQFNSFQDLFYTPLIQQKTFQGLVRDTGLQVKNTGQGYYEITGFIGDAAKATGVARSQTAGLASNMSNAADAARSFYNSLNAAAGLPPARFTGGPVDAGGTYRINDGPSGLSLGQESFLSASGALSLINRPMNSLWTAPSKGTVIPAHVTSRLKEAGALGGAGVLRAGPDPAMAHLAAAVGNLSQKVDELNRKAWNVSVGVRGDGSALKLQQTMQRIR